MPGLSWIDEAAKTYRCRWCGAQCDGSDTGLFDRVLCQSCAVLQAKHLEPRSVLGAA